MKTVTETQQEFAQLAGKSVEALALWADATQKVLREVVDLSASTAREGVRLYAELQSSAIDAVREGEGYWRRWQTDLAEWPKDPCAWYGKSVLDGIDETQKAVKLVESDAQAVTRSAERVQAVAAQAAREIQQAYAGLATRVTTLYTGPEQ